MYSELNTEDIVKSRMFRNVPSDVDKSEGSLIYDAISPVSQEVVSSYINMDEILNMVFAQSAAENGYSKQLQLRCAEFGVIQKNGSSSTGQVTFSGTETTPIPIGSIIQTTGALQFETIAYGVITNGVAIVNIKAVSIGSAYNVPTNTIIQIPAAISGITGVSNTTNTSGGTNVETDLALLERLLLQVQTPSTSGNSAHYVQWALQVDGIGLARAFPLWNGNGTVKVVIVDSNKKCANTDLINKVSAHIEENRPIGATVSVVSAVEKQINVIAKVTLASGYNISNIQEEFLKILDIYLKDIAFADTYLSYAKLGNIFLNTPGVLDYSDLKVNNEISNIGLKDEEIPIIGTVELGV
ncbi:baseplate J/gp47 family protein [Clostridium sp. FP1]|uniref:baseplate J/gp47 family protein n=1 Tax=Clostridium sp. FP1 TaxID=2724076 RepID=UPI0013E8F5AA|nr:baseplate J/gp47 family protein [Clostridium sp. FP1]MBZ9635578.1 baseplate J/gp47 family protein [Clostridium sp. FP1]